MLVYACDKNILALLEEQGKLEDFQNRVKKTTDPLQISLFVPDDSQLFNITNKASNGGYHHDKFDYPGQKKYIIYKPEDRAFLLQHLQPVYYSETACSVVSFSDYSFLLPNSYQTELKEILSRAKMETPRRY